MTYPAFPPSNTISLFCSPFDPAFMTQSIQLISLNAGTVAWLIRSGEVLFDSCDFNSPAAAPGPTNTPEVVPLMYGPRFGYMMLDPGGHFVGGFPPPPPPPS